MPALLPAPSRQAYADFLGVDVSTLSTPADQAVLQATLLYQTFSELTAVPTEEPCASLYNNAIFDMARWIQETQKWIAAIASPFQSETIGSYSYSTRTKANFLQGWQSGKWNTGVFWFDLAMQQCMAESTSQISSDGITVFEHDSVVVDSEGHRWVVSPQVSRGWVAADPTAPEFNDPGWVPYPLGIPVGSGSGAIGPAGPPGPPGPPGYAAPDASYIHTQVIQALVWEIVHNLGKIPTVQTFDEDGVEIIGALEFPDTDTVRVTFSQAVAGKAYLN